MSAEFVYTANLHTIVSMCEKPPPVGCRARFLDPSDDLRRVTITRQNHTTYLLSVRSGLTTLAEECKDGWLAARADAVSLLDRADRA